MSTSVSNPYTFNIQNNTVVNAILDYIKWPVTLNFNAVQFKTPNHEVAYGYIGGNCEAIDSDDNNISNFLRAFYIIPIITNSNVINMKFTLSLSLFPTDAMHPDFTDFYVEDVTGSTGMSYVTLNAETLIKEPNGFYAVSGSSDDTDATYNEYINWLLVNMAISNILQAMDNGALHYPITIRINNNASRSK